MGLANYVLAWTPSTKLSSFGEGATEAREEEWREQVSQSEDQVMHFGQEDP